MSKKVLILAAHPDDETLGCGATISRLSKEGNRLHLLTFTDGTGARQNTEYNRNDKLIEVCEHLGIHEYDHADFPDNKMDTVSMLDVCKFIEEKVKYTPDIIFTHHPGCLNIDHSIVYRATMTAFRPQNGSKTSILCYYVPSSTEYNPLSNFSGNLYYDVRDYKDVKIKCLEKYYPEEMREKPHSRSYENVENLMKTWGSEVGLEYAEKFQTMRSVL